MAIHFNFVVSDVDALNIMGGLDDDILKHNTDIIERMAEIGPNADYEGDDHIKWYRARIAYVKELRLKMKNCRTEIYNFLDEKEQD